MIELNGKKYRLVVYDTNFMSDTVKDPRGFGRAALDRVGRERTLYGVTLFRVSLNGVRRQMKWDRSSLELRDTHSIE